jgi:peptide/nickel transport system permease protein
VTTSAILDPEPAAPRAASRVSRPARILGGVGLVLLGVVVLGALGASVIAEHPPGRTVGASFLPPSGEHWLGTDDIGRDLFAQLLHGARVSVSVGLGAAVLAVGIGTVTALVSGYRGGWWDVVLMRLVDLSLTLPLLVLVLVLTAFLGRALPVTVLLIAGVLWARPARLLRSQVLKIRQFGHVAAAESMGASKTRVALTHVLPRLVPLISSQLVRAATVAVVVQAGIAFLGLGDPDRVSWGTMLFFANASNAMLTDAWRWWVVPPGVALSALVLGLALVGYAVEEWAEPRLARNASRRARRRPRPQDEPRAQAEGTTLELRRVCVCFEGGSEPVEAVRDVDLVVRRGRALGLAGESGSGKSTLALAVVGLVPEPGRVSVGEVMFGGRDLRRIGRTSVARVRGREVALVPQSAMNALNPARTVHRQVTEAAELTRPAREARARATELLERVGIDRQRHHAYPHQFSGGMRQRVLIAMALANQPRLVIADEPVTGLDVVNQVVIMELLSGLVRELDLDLLVISHELPLLARWADDLAVMYAGEVVERGPVDRLLRQPRHPYTKLLLSSFPDLYGPRGTVGAVPGEPPDLSRLPAGCAFEARCPCAGPECVTTRPALVDVGHDHVAACLISGDDRIGDLFVDPAALAAEGDRG